MANLPRDELLALGLKYFASLPRRRLRDSEIAARRDEKPGKGPVEQTLKVAAGDRRSPRGRAGGLADPGAGGRPGRAAPAARRPRGAGPARARAGRRGGWRLARGGPDRLGGAASGVSRPALAGRDPAGRAGAGRPRSPGPPAASIERLARQGPTAAELAAARAELEAEAKAAEPRAAHWASRARGVRLPRAETRRALGKTGRDLASVPRKRCWTSCVDAWSSRAAPGHRHASDVNSGGPATYNGSGHVAATSQATPRPRPAAPRPGRRRRGACLRAFELEFDYVYRALLRQGVTASDAEDLVQDVFLVTWRRWADFDTDRPLRPWLAGIAFKVASEHLKRRRRWEPRAWLDPPDQTPAGEEALASSRDPRAGPAGAGGARRSAARADRAARPRRRCRCGRSPGMFSVPLFTAYSRLRAARRAFADLVERGLPARGREARRPRAPSALRPCWRLERPPPAAPPDVRRRSLSRMRGWLLLPAAPLAPADAGAAARRRAWRAGCRRPLAAWGWPSPLAVVVGPWAACPCRRMASPDRSSPPGGRSAGEPRPSRRACHPSDRRWTARQPSIRLSVGPALRRARRRRRLSRARTAPAGGKWWRLARRAELVGHWRFEAWGARRRGSPIYSGNGNTCTVARPDGRSSWPARAPSRWPGCAPSSPSRCGSSRRRDRPAAAGPHRPPDGLVPRALLLDRPRERLHRAAEPRLEERHPPPLPRRRRTAGATSPPSTRTTAGPRSTWTASWWAAATRAAAPTWAADPAC